MTRGAESGRRRLTLVSAIAIPVLALTALVSWGLSSAVGSSPDDEFHLVSIWCGHGDNPNGCAPGPSPELREVRTDLLVDAVCFSYKPDTSAACQGTDFGSSLDDVTVTDRSNASGLYPPVFYFAMSAFAGADIEASVLLMRVANSVLFVGLVTVLFLLLPAHRRSTLVWALAITIVPLGLFIVPSTNPSSWAVISAGTLFVALLGYVETRGRRRIALGAVATVATVLGAGARADSALYAGLAIVLVVLLTARRDRDYWMTALLPAGLAVLAAGLYLTANQSSDALSGLAPTGERLALGPVVLTLINLISVPTLWAGVFGSWNLGWLDTELPAGVWVAGLAVFAGIVFLAIGNRLPRKSLALAIVTVALWAVPTVVLVRSAAVAGAYVQPRYILPLMILLAGVALLRDRDTPIRLTAVQSWIPVVALSFANVVALQTNIRRYVTGADVFSVDLNAGIEWWWNLPVSPMAVWIVGSIAFAGALVLVRPLLVERDPAAV